MHPTLIHYGSDFYDINRVKPIKNRLEFPKPFGGFWTSPLNSNYGWFEWCIENNFKELNKCCFLKFKSNAKIYIINKYIDLVKLPLVNPFRFRQTINFEQTAKWYDAIWLTERGQYVTNLYSNLSLYGWDCESILILNSNIIYQI